MALQVAYTLPGTNLTATDAYVRIKTISGTKSRIEINVDIFENADMAAIPEGANHTTGHPISHFSFSITPDLASEDNIIKQGYIYMKTLDQFANAVDV